MKYVLAQKRHMESLWNDETGKMTAVTVVTAGPAFVSQVKTKDADGYSAVQLVFGTKKKTNKAQSGHYKSVDANAFAREFRMSEEEATKAHVGAIAKAGAFSVGDSIQVTGVSKGHGFQGVVKRHGFKGGPASHGHKDQLRMPGSIGATDAARVFKGMRMGGQMGDTQVTTTGLVVEKVDTEKGLLYIRGSVPGAINGYLIIKGDGDMTFDSAPAKEDTADKKEAINKEEKPEVVKDEKHASKEADESTGKDVKEDVKEEVKA